MDEAGSCRESPFMSLITGEENRNSEHRLSTDGGGTAHTLVCKELGANQISDPPICLPKPVAACDGMGEGYSWWFLGELRSTECDAL